MGLQRDPAELRIFLPLGELISVLLASSAQCRTLQLCPELLFLRLPGMWGAGRLGELDLSRHSDILGAPRPLAVPWKCCSQSQRPRALTIWQLPLQTHLVPFHSLQFPGYFLKGSGCLQCAWEAKLSVTQPQSHPVLQESLGPTRLHQYLTAGLGVFPPGALSSEADNLTSLFIE